MPALDWPAVLAPTSIDWHILPQSRSGGRSISGHEQNVVSPAGLWVATLVFRINSPAERKAMAGLVAGLDGKAGSVNVPMFICRPGTDGTTPSGGAEGDTEIEIDVGGDDPLLEVGENFTYSWRAYRVTKIVATIGTVQTVQFRPRLRDDIAAATSLEFATPGCEMKLASDETGRMALQMLRYGEVTLDLVEAF